MKIVSIIPIKTNNERLPGKNTRSLGGVPLITYVQKLVLGLDKISERYVFCSDETIKSYLLSGIQFLQRDSSLDEASTNFTQIFTSFCNQIDADIYVYAHATAPYIDLNTAQECLDKVVSGEYDSAFCAVKLQDFLWQNGLPLNFDASNLPRSQDLPVIYRETSGVYVFTKNVFDLYKRRIGQKPFIKEVSFRESIDINTKEDFIIAESFCNIK